MKTISGSIIHIRSSLNPRREKKQKETAFKMKKRHKKDKDEENLQFSKN